MRNLAIQTTKKVTISLSADDWELYSLPGRHDVAIAINSEIEGTVNGGADKATVRKSALSVMRHFEELGAFDSEPIWKLDAILTEVFDK